MKTIVLIDYDISVLGGVEKVTEQLANKLSNNFEVVVISLNKTNDIIPYSFDSKIKIIFSSNNKNERLRDTIKRNYKSLNKIFKAYNISLAICMGHYSSFVTLIAKKFRKIKIINCDHGALINQYDDKKMVFIRKFNYLFSTHTVLLTNKNKADYIKLMHAKENKITVIYNSINKKLVLNGKKAKYNEKSKKIITIGRLTSEKGFDMLIRVASKLKKITNINWQWDIYGDGPLKEEIEKEIEKNRLSKFVLMKGQNNNVIELLNNYAFYVLPSYREGLPIVLLEAKAYKLPIVSFDVDTGPREIIEDGKNGFLIEKYNIDLMAKKIKELLESQEIRQDFSKNSAIGLEKFNEEKIIGDWIELIEKITKE